MRAEELRFIVELSPHTTPIRECASSRINKRFYFVVAGDDDSQQHSRPIDTLPCGRPPPLIKTNAFIGGEKKGRRPIAQRID